MDFLRSIFIALIASVVIHALFAVGLVVCLEHAPETEVLATLDLTSVDLSFAETVEETAAAVASLPSASVEAAPPPPPVDVAPPPPPADAASSPRQPEPKQPSPAESPEIPSPAIVEQVAKVERRETRDEKRTEAKIERPRETKIEKPQPPRHESPAAAASAPRQARVDAPPRPRRSIKPDYPRESRLRGEHGDVSLELDVAADGSVSEVRVLKSPGYPLLDEAAVKAARGARFTPAKSGGRSVASTVRLTLNFRLK